MKAFSRIFILFSVLMVLITLSGCEKKMTVESVVHEDGSIDRTLVFFDADSGKINSNIFGIRPENGWDVESEKYNDPEKKARDKIKITFHKRFPSVNEVNREMNTGSETVFKIRSDIEKRFRWFYTYMKYSDTYVCINRFRIKPLDDYFTSEDFAFINRLPAEGKPITKADSLYLERLNEKIFDHFVVRMVYEEHFETILDVLRKNQIDQQWVDTVKGNKEKMYFRLLNEKDNIVDNFMIPLLDSLHIPLASTKIIEDYNAALSDLEKRIDFMSGAAETKFSHAITMPWNIIASNADSVSGSSLYWQPPAIKFMLNDYTMEAESRKLNYWALLISAGLIIVTIIVFFGHRKPSDLRKPFKS